jgi:uncharacterized protein (DUF697 family)
LPRLSIHPGAIWGAVREVRAQAADFRPLLLAGAPERVAPLRTALVEGGDPSAVRDLSGHDLTAYDLDGADALVYVVEGESASPADEAAFRLADRKGVDLLCVVVTPTGELPPTDLPFVPATQVIPVRPTDPPPVEAVAERIATATEATNYTLAAKLPAVRMAICEGIVRRFSRQNGILGAAIFIPGADLPALTINQIRMVLRIAAAYGQEIDRERAVELLAVLGAGFGFRAAARELAGLVPGPGWALKGGIAYAGTKALGEAAIRYFDTRSRSVRSAPISK